MRMVVTPDTYNMVLRAQKNLGKRDGAPWARHEVLRLAMRELMKANRWRTGYAAKATGKETA